MNKVLFGKPHKKLSLGRRGLGWEHHFKIDLEEVGCVSVDWIQLTHDRVR